MPSKWNIEFYENDDRVNPVQAYITEGKDAKRIALLINIIERLKTLGPDLQGTKMDKHIDGPIRELRKDRHRILYGRSGNTFVLLTAFLKKTQKTPNEQIVLAKQRFEEYLKKHKQK